MSRNTITAPITSPSSLRIGVLVYSTGKLLPSPEHLVVDEAWLAVGEGGAHRALLARVVAAVGPGVVQEYVVLAPADQLAGRPAGELVHRRVDEGGEPVAVDAGDAVADGLEDQLEAALDAVLGPVQAVEVDDGRHQRDQQEQGQGPGQGLHAVLDQDVAQGEPGLGS